MAGHLGPSDDLFTHDSRRALEHSSRSQEIVNFLDQAPKALDYSLLSRSWRDADIGIRPQLQKKWAATAGHMALLLTLAAKTRDGPRESTDGRPKATRFVRMRRQKGPRRTWLGWQERSPGQMAALIPHDACLELSAIEKAIAIAGRGAALFRSRKVSTPLDDFIIGLEHTRRSEQCRHTRKTLTWCITSARRWRSRWKLEAILQACTTKRMSCSKKHRLKPDLVLVGGGSMRSKIDEFKVFWQTTLTAGTRRRRGQDIPRAPDAA